MYPAESYEVMLILYVKQLLFRECFTRVRSSTLFGEDQVCDVQLITRLRGDGREGGRGERDRERGRGREGGEKKEREREREREGRGKEGGGREWGRWGREGERGGYVIREITSS